MTSFYQRYVAGEYQAVWAELRALDAIPVPLIDDADAVAAETMRRAAKHVRRFSAALVELGFVSAGTTPTHEPATAEDRATVQEVAAAIGGMPLALAHCLNEIGQVSFVGDCPALDLTYHSASTATGMPPGAGYPDPLCLPNAALLRYEWDEYIADRNSGWREAGFVFPFAPDELHKANISGGTHDIWLPDTHPDPIVQGVAGRVGITLVEYLRVSIAWGGFPGWSFNPTQAPPALAALRTTPDF